MEKMTNPIGVNGMPSEVKMKNPIGVNGMPSEVKLTDEGSICWKDSAGIEKCLVIKKEVLGFKDEGSDGKWRIRVWALVMGEKKKERNRKDFVLDFETEDDMKDWSCKLRDYLHTLDVQKD